jgi:Asp/Glu/hydantoin racemase
MDHKEIISLVKDLLQRPQMYVGYPLEAAGQVEALVGIAISVGRSLSVVDGRKATRPLIGRATEHLKLPRNRGTSLSCESISPHDIYSYDGLRRNTSRLLLELAEDPKFAFIEEWRQELEKYLMSSDEEQQRPSISNGDSEN